MIHSPLENLPSMDTLPQLLSGFDPPYDSPLEAHFAQCLPKYIEDSARFYKQYEVVTARGTFRLDFAVHCMKGIFGFECDGKEFHEYYRDMLRDSLILGSSEIISIHRISGSDIHKRLEDVLYAISEIEPDVFSERGKKNLWTLSSARSNIEVTDVTDAASVINSQSGDSFMVRRLSKRSENKLWRKIYEYALVHPEWSNADIVAEFEKDGMRNAVNG